MKILLLLICFISTSVFAGEHKANSSSATKLMDRGGNTSNLCVGVGGKVAKTCNKEPGMHQGAMNSVRPQKPGSTTGGASTVKKSENYDPVDPDL